MNKYQIMLREEDHRKLKALAALHGLTIGEAIRMLLSKSEDGFLMKSGGPGAGHTTKQQNERI